MSIMTSKDSPTANNPIIIVGAGPAGLLAAIVLEQNGTLPFVLVEKAPLSKICSNAGSGFDLAPTAMSIMKERLGLAIEDAFPRYERVHVGTMGGDGVAIRSADLDAESYGASRSTMQHFFLEVLLGEKWKVIQKMDPDTQQKNTAARSELTQSGMGELRCGSGVSGYKETDDCVTVQLDNGTEIVGSVLLGCDGIHSAVRRQMVSQFIDKEEGNGDGEDPYNYCGINCWWGKTKVEDTASELHRLVKETQTDKATNTTQKHTLSFMLGTRQHPGTFFLVPTEQTDVFNWILCVAADSPPKKSSDDFTRRGGFVLDENDKKELQDRTQDYCPLIRQVVQDTPADKMTNVGLFDRENLNLPYSTDKRVAVLGDAAHPQSPFMGQGCNMALTDAYVLATRLCHQSSISEALSAFNSSTRRTSVNKVIEDARYYGNMSVSDHWFTCWALKMTMKYMPVSWLLKELVGGGDQSNADFVKEMHSDLEKLEEE